MHRLSAAAASPFRVSESERQRAPALAKRAARAYTRAVVSATFWCLLLGHDLVVVDVPAKPGWPRMDCRRCGMKDAPPPNPLQALLRGL